MFSFFARRELIFAEVEGIKFVFSANSTRKNLKKFEFLKSSMKNIPQIVKDKMVERNIIVRFTTKEEVAKLTGQDNVLGVYCEAGVEVIYIKDSQNYRELENTLYHEIGHFVDRYIGKSVDSEYASLIDFRFQAIASEEMEVYEFDYYKSNIKEYFAQSFAETILNSNIIKSTPKTFEAMNEFVDALYFCQRG